MCSREISHLCPRQSLIPLVFLLCACLLFAYRLSLALAFELFFSSKILSGFLVGSEIFSVLRATMWLQVEEIATTDFLLVEKVHVAFSNLIRNIPLSQNTNQKL